MYLRICWYNILNVEIVVIIFYFFFTIPGAQIVTLWIYDLSVNLLDIYI
jgi:hypothetical protein